MNPSRITAARHRGLMQRGYPWCPSITSQISSITAIVPAAARIHSVCAPAPSSALVGGAASAVMRYGCAWNVDVRRRWGSTGTGTGTGTENNMGIGTGAGAGAGTGSKGGGKDAREVAASDGASTEGVHSTDSSSVPTPTSSSVQLPSPTSTSTSASTSTPGGAGPAEDVAGSIVHNAKYYSDMVNRQYFHFEEALLRRVSESNKKNIRYALAGTLAALVLVVVVFGTRIRKKLSAQTADIAKETLENEGLKIQTQELAMAVVNTVLNDKEVTAQASLFLREASNAPETQLALLSLSLHVLRHPDCMAELQVLVQKVLERMSKDEATKATFVDLFTQILTDPQLSAVLRGAVVDVCNDPKLNEAIKGVLVSTLSLPEVNEATTAIATQTSKDLLSNREVKEYSQEFLAEVVGDARLQKESGAALYNSIAHALNPGVLRLVGAGLVVLSVGFLEVVLSSY